MMHSMNSPDAAGASKRGSRYLIILCVLFAAQWAAWAIHPKYRANWAVENALLVAAVALAGLGALITMAVVASVNWKLDRNFGGELRESLRVGDGDRPLGEVRLSELRRGRQEDEG